MCLVSQGFPQYISTILLATTANRLIRLQQFIFSLLISAGVLHIVSVTRYFLSFIQKKHISSNPHTLSFYPSPHLPISTLAWFSLLHKIFYALVPKFLSSVALFRIKYLHDCSFLLIIKPTRCTISQISLWNRTLHVSDSFFVHLLASSQHNLYDIYLLLCVQCQTPDDGQRNCPKRVEFYSQNKFEKLVNLVGSIIRIYHDARSSECQI